MRNPYINPANLLSLSRPFLSSGRRVGDDEFFLLPGFTHADLDALSMGSSTLMVVISSLYRVLIAAAGRRTRIDLRIPIPGHWSPTSGPVRL